MVMGMGTMRAKITQWWKAKKKFSARFREAVAWATISAFLRAVFGSLIDTFGWGPLIAAILLGGVSSVIAWLAEASWYWVLVVGFVIGALILLLAVKAATNLKKQNRLQDKQDLRRLEAQLASPSEPNAVSKALLHSAIGLRKGILRDRLEANRQRVQSQQFQRIVQTITSQKIHSNDLMNADKTKLRPNQIELVTQYQVRQDELNRWIDDVAAGRLLGDEKAAKSLLHRLEKLAVYLDELIDNWEK